MKKFFKWLAAVIIFGLFLVAAYEGWMKYQMIVADSKVEEIYSVLFEDSSVRQGDRVINMYAALFDDESAEKGHMIFDDFQSGKIQIRFINEAKILRELMPCSFSEKGASYLIASGVGGVRKFYFGGTKIGVVHCGDKIRASLFDGGDNNAVQTKVYSYKKEDITHFRGGSVVSRDSSPVKQSLLQFLNEEQSNIKLIRGLRDYHPDAVRNTLDLIRMAYKVGLDDVNKVQQENARKPSCDVTEQPKEPLAWPTDQGWITSHYGMRMNPFSGKKSMHYGVDITSHSGSPVLASQAGVITLVDRIKAVGHDAGRIVDIDHDGGYRTRYARVGKVIVKNGDTVKVGQLVGYFLTPNEQTGFLHFEVFHCDQRVDPKPFIHL